MEERLLKFVRIVDAGSFTRAAHALRISQPALTTAVKKLERELGAELLVRGARGFTLTAAGQLAYNSAKALYGGLQNLRLQLAQQAGQKLTIHFGMIDSVADLLFVHNPYLRDLEQVAQLSLAVDNSGRLVQQVEQDELDVAFIARPKRLPTSLSAQAIGEEPLVFVAHTADAEKITRELSSNQLRHFLCYNQASRTFELIIEQFARAGVSVTPQFYSTSPEIMLQLVLAGRGAAVLPYLLVRPHLTRGELASITIGGSPIISRQIMAVYRRGRLLADPVRALLIQTQKQLEILSTEAGITAAPVLRMSYNKDK